MIRSLQWPGSVTIYANNRTMSIYVGNGLKYEGGSTGSSAASYFPVFPPKVMQDPVEFKEQPEPNPKELPVQAVPAENQQEEEAKGEEAE